MQSRHVRLTRPRSRAPRQTVSGLGPPSQPASGHQLLNVTDHCAPSSTYSTTMAELSPEERIKLAVQFIVQSPPGEVK